MKEETAVSLIFNLAYKMYVIQCYENYTCLIMEQHVKHQLPENAGNYKLKFMFII